MDQTDRYAIELRGIDKRFGEVYANKQIDLNPDTIDEWRLTSHTWRVDGDVITTVHRRTGNERSWITTPHVFGVVADRVTVRDTDGHEWLIGIDRYPAPVRALLEEIAGPLVLDAVLTAADRETVRSGTLSGDALRRVVLERAWEMAARDGIDAADVLLHGAIDLFRLAEAPLPAAIRVDALARLAELPSGPSRDELADRFGVAVES